MSESIRVPVVALALQTVLPRVLRLRWLFCALLTPTLVFPFAWAILVWLVLRVFAWLGDPETAIRRARGGAIVVEDGVVTCEEHLGTTRIPCADVVEGWILPQPDATKTVVVLRIRDGRRIVARSWDIAAARALLEAAGVAVHQRILEVPLGSLAAAAGHGTVMHLLGPVLLGLVILSMTLVPLMVVLDPGTGLLGSLAAVVAYAMASVGAAVGLAHYLAPGRAVVGADGVRVARLLRTRFVPYERVRAVGTRGGSVVLSTDGGDMVLHTATFVRDQPEARDALEERLVDAIEGFRAERLAAATRDLFARKGLPVAAWKEEIRRLSQRGADYRSAALESEDIARVAEDPSVPPDRRIGAALSLSARDVDPALRERVRVAASATANARLRIALDRALEGELAEDDLTGIEAESRA